MRKGAARAPVKNCYALTRNVLLHIRTGRGTPLRKKCFFFISACLGWAFVLLGIARLGEALVPLGEPAWRGRSFLLTSPLGGGAGRLFLPARKGLPHGRGAGRKTARARKLLPTSCGRDTSRSAASAVKFCPATVGGVLCKKMRCAPTRNVSLRIRTGRGHPPTKKFFPYKHPFAGRSFFLAAPAWRGRSLFAAPAWGARTFRKESACPTGKRSVRFYFVKFRPR